MDRLMVLRTDRWMEDGWMDGWMNEWINRYG